MLTFFDYFLYRTHVNLLLNKKLNINITSWEIGIIMWIFYIVIRSAIQAESDSYYLVYITACLLFTIALTNFFREGIELFSIYKYFAWFGLLQFCVVLFQSLSIIDSDGIFKVQGTFHNPNITGMYIAICTPYYLKKIVDKKNVKLNILFLIMLIIGLILLKCRTAYIGLFVIVLTFLFTIPEIKKILFRKRRIYKYLFFVVGLFCLLSLSSYLYQNKKDSADGRLFIWKTSIEMAKQSPVIGYGYGFFDKKYNINQEEYFRKDTSSKQEEQNARYTYMPYNDYVENTIYGGMIGLVFYILFLIIPGYYAAKQTDKTALSVILAIIVMGMTNFIIQAAPVWMLALVMIAYSMSKSNLKEIKVFNNKLVFIVLFITTIITGHRIIKLTYGQVLLKEAVDSMNKKNIRNELKPIFEKCIINIGEDGKAYILYSKYLLKQKREKEAKEQLLNAEKYSSDPEIFINLSYCYFKEGNIEEAEKCLMTAKNIIPSYFKAKYSLLQLYRKTKQTDKAILLSKEILAMSYNNKNKDAMKARELALTYTSQLN